VNLIQTIYKEDVTKHLIDLLSSQVDETYNTSTNQLLLLLVQYSRYGSDEFHIFNYTV
jgi:hypothetical protein